MAGIIVHEWFSATGGSEKVVDVLVEALPASEVWCLWNDVPDIRYPNHSVRQSWIAQTPLRRHKALALPFMLPTWNRVRVVQDAEWVLASSHLFAHQVRIKGVDRDIPKYSLVHTPARYIWEPALDSRGAGVLGRLTSPTLRSIDRRRAAGSDHVAGVSKFVRDRIRASWNRDAHVIYSPVETKYLQAKDDWSSMVTAEEYRVLETLPRSFLLGASRLVRYKGLDLAIKAGEATQLPVVIVGDGPDRDRLMEIAERVSVPVLFLGRTSDALLYSLYQAASAYMFMSVEDFGIMPVEAMALGTPVVGLSIGGVSETVKDGVTGALVNEPESSNELAVAVGRAIACDPDDCRRRALDFDSEVFVREVQSWLRERNR